jgi:type VI secretion system protein ImpA
MRLDGFAGCRDGLRLLISLLEKYWPDLHPQMNEGDPENRVGTFVWLNEKLSMQLKLIPITAPQSNDLQPYSFADWEMAGYLEQLPERNQNATRASDTEAPVNLTHFHASVMQTTTQSYLKLFDEMNATGEACLSLDALLEEKMGSQSPGLQRFIETLSGIQSLVADILHARPEEPGLASTERGTQRAAVAAEGHEAGSEIWSAQPIRSRAEAYWRLSEAAEYLLRTEPHSPTPYLVQRAVEWGSMSLFDLFQQIIRNEGEMQEINKLLRLTNKEGGG